MSDKQKKYKFSCGKHATLPASACWGCKHDEPHTLAEEIEKYKNICG